MVGAYGGFIIVINYADAAQAFIEEHDIITEDSQNILTEDSRDLQTES